LAADGSAAVAVAPQPAALSANAIPTMPVTPATKKEAAKHSEASKPGAGGGAAPAPIVAEEKAIEAAPITESAVPPAAAAPAEPTERANRSGWATRMMSLPPETENVLRQSLAQRENQPAGRLRQLELQKNEGASASDAEVSRNKDSDKSKSDAQSKQHAEQQEGLSWLEGGAGDQVQAVLVFRLAAPAKAKPVASPTPAASSAPAAPAVKAAK
jgi:hypothetical protein